MLITSLVACTGSPVGLDKSEVDDSVVDVRVTDDDLGPLDASQVVLDGPEIEIPGASDTMICLFGTYTGPTVGLHDIHTYQGPFGHHFTLNGTTTPALDAPDGTVVDCTTENATYKMADLQPLGIPNEISIDGEDKNVSLPLPEGMAVELESGQRYILQSHYLNTGEHPILIRDRAVLSTMDPTGVSIWTAPWILNRDDMLIPAGGDLTTTFSCAAQADWSVLYLTGHMHEWGTSFRVAELTDAADDEWYSVPHWDPVYRDAPPVTSFVASPLQIPAGTQLSTTCSWFNDTDADLEFPHEMCDTVMMVFPQKATVVCDGNGQ